MMKHIQQFFAKVKIRGNLIVLILAVFTIFSATTYAYMAYKFAKKTRASVTCVGSPQQTCTFLNGSHAITNGQYDGADIIIDNSTVTLSGTHNFRSMVVKNNSVVTHAALIAPTISPSFIPSPDFNVANNVLSDDGKEKKVVLNIQDNLVLQAGGRINADFAGYPGGDPAKPYDGCGAGCGPASFPNCRCGYGYGPGGGENEHYYDEWTRGAGGSFGGRGGQWQIGNGGFAQPTYLNAGGVDGTQHGSGGGSALRSRHNSRSPGGPGGGVIFIVAGDIETDGNPLNSISANGSNVAQALCSSWAMCGGSGSGGSVYIRLTKYTGKTRFSTTAAGGRSDLTWIFPMAAGGNGETVVRGLTNDTGIELPVRANGGAGGPDTINWYSSTGGGGGRIVVEAKQDFTIKKELLPINRAGSSSFDPYSIRVGDRIKVKITVERIDSNTTIKDEELKQTSGTKCESIKDAYNKVIMKDEITGATIYGTVDGSTVVWSNSDPARTRMEYSYECVVK